MARGFNRTVAPCSIQPTYEPPPPVMHDDMGVFVNALHAKLNQCVRFTFKMEGNNLIKCYTQASPIGSGTNAKCQAHSEFYIADDKTITYRIVHELYSPYHIDWRVTGGITKHIRTSDGTIGTTSDPEYAYSMLLHKMEDVREDNFDYAKRNNDWDKPARDAFFDEMKADMMKVVTPEFIESCKNNSKSSYYPEFFDVSPTMAIKIGNNADRTKYAVGYVFNPNNKDKYVSFSL